MVGFNRRFSPWTAKLRGALNGRSGPLTTLITVNAGAIPRNHWTQDPLPGGGRIVGEACHFIDLARALSGAAITGLDVVAARDCGGAVVDDIASLDLTFADGSIATISYFSNGPASFPQERVECFFDGRVFQVDNWRRLVESGRGAPWRRMRGGVNKGHGAEVDAWLAAVAKGERSPIPLEEQLEISRWAIRTACLARRSGPE